MMVVDVDGDDDDQDEEQVDIAINVYWSESFNYLVNITHYSLVGELLEQVRERASKDGCPTAPHEQPQNDDWAQLLIDGWKIKDTKVYDCSESLERGHANSLYEELKEISKTREKVRVVRVLLNDTRRMRTNRPPGLPYWHTRHDLLVAIVDPNDPSKPYDVKDKATSREVEPHTSELRFYIDQQSAKIVRYEVESCKMEEGALDLEWMRMLPKDMTIHVGGAVKRIIVKGLEAESEYKFRVRTIGESASNHRWAVSGTTARTRKEKPPTEHDYASDAGTNEPSSASLRKRKVAASTPDGKRAQKASSKRPAVSSACGSSAAGSSAAGPSGSTPPDDDDALKAALYKVKQLYDDGLLDRSVWQEKQKEILKRFL